MHRVPIGYAIFFLVIQIFLYFGDGDCGANCVIDKEYLGMTIIANICFLIFALRGYIYAIYKYIRNKY